LSSRNLTLELKRVLVTGGAGFIGSHLAEELVNKNLHVTVLDNLSSGKIENIERLFNRDNFVFIQGDMRNERTLFEILRGIDVVFHEAAMVNVDESIEFPKVYADVNINGTLNLLEAARRADVERIVFASSSSVYGDNSSTHINEDAHLNPSSPYALTKLVSERYCLLYQELYGLKTVILRYFNVFGPRQNTISPYAGVIPRFIWRIMKGQPPEIYGDGEQTRDFVHVKDVLQANILAATSEKAVGEIFNIGSGEPTSINCVASTIIKLVGNQKLQPIYTRKRKGDIPYSCANIEKVKKLLKYQPKIRLVEGLKSLLNDFSSKA